MSTVGVDLCVSGPGSLFSWPRGQSQRQPTHCLVNKPSRSVSATFRNARVSDGCCQPLKNIHDRPSHVLSARCREPGCTCRLRRRTEILMQMCTVDKYRKRVRAPHTVDGPHTGVASQDGHRTCSRRLFVFASIHDADCVVAVVLLIDSRQVKAAHTD